MLDIDTAIKHCLEVAEENDLAAGTYELLAENNHNAYEKLTAETNSSRCAECAADHRQLAEWLTELKEAKRLLKAAVEDLSCGGENNKCTKSCNTCTHSSIKNYGCRYFGEYHWRYEAEALALIGEDTNVPASADDTNVGHKSGGWISVNDRLPEAVEEDVNGKIAFSEFVLVYLVYDNGFTYITNDKCRVDSKSWLHEIPGEGCKVTHWQPLPEPPKDGDTNE